MKKVVLAAVAALVGMYAMSGCYKEKLYPQAEVLVMDTTWVIDKHVSGNIDACQVPHLAVFKDDSTGFYYYPSKCDANDVDTLRFHWHFSVEDKNIYLSNINGDPTANVVVGISDYTSNILRLRGGRYRQRYLDGYFVRLGSQ